MPYKPLVTMIALSFWSLCSVHSSQAMADPGKGHGHGKAKTQHEQPTSSAEVDAQLSVQMAGVTLTVGTARQLAAQYQLQGAKPLPPGIRKQLARGKPLPPGLARQQLPASYVQQLPARDGCQWSQVGSDLVLVAIATGVVVELLSDVF